MSYVSEKVRQIIEVLHHKKIRCTYGALADCINANPRDVSKYLSPRRPEASWVVNKKTGKPTGYEPYQIHPDLETNAKVIDQAVDLKNLIGD